MKRSLLHWPARWRKKRILRESIFYSTRDLVISALLYLGSVILCLLLRQLDPRNDSSYVAMIFLLDVFLTALLTDGYLFSLLMAVVGVLSVDYIFTPPYWTISFTMAGFPLTFLVMLFISVATATITTRAKNLDAARREAERERLHADLLRAISHDIRTPLTGIVGATNVLLEQTELTEQQRRELLLSANEDAQWLVRIVENLLSITRVAPGEEARLHKVHAAAEEIIESALSKFRRRYPEICTEVILPDEVLLVPMDELLMEQVLLNLLENAVLHGETTTTVRIALARQSGSAVITVEDDGRGIPGSRLETLWNGYAKSAAQGDTKRSMGIGLRVCKAVAEAHGGSIRGENRTGGGARFAVYLPMEEERHEDQG